MLPKMFVALILSLFVILLGCQKSERQPEPGSTMDSLTAGESTTGSAHVPFSPPQLSEREWQAILKQERLIQQHPDEVSLREALCRISYYPEKEALIVVGVGRLRNPQTGQVIQEYLAERAAVVDAQRWAAYISRWLDSGFQPAFGQLSGYQALPLAWSEKVVQGDSLLVRAVFRRTPTP